MKSIIKLKKKTMQQNMQWTISLTIVSSLILYQDCVVLCKKKFLLYQSSQVMYGRRLSLAVEMYPRETIQLVR